MGEVWFYHMTRFGVDAVLPPLLEKTLQRGWRACVEVPDTARRAHLDTHLWTYRDESFLPHGADGEPGAEAQPVLLTGSTDNRNDANIRFLVDGAECDSADAYERVIYLFDGNDDDAVARARGYWKRMKDTGATVTYWQQTPEGGWDKKA